MNGPSVSVSTRSLGIAAASCRPFLLRSIVGPTLNQHPSMSARASSVSTKAEWAGGRGMGGRAPGPPPGPHTPLLSEMYPLGAIAANQIYAAAREGNPMDFVVGREIYSHLEKVTDRFEDVANQISGLVIDHA